MDQPTTHFGYESVPVADKARRVAEVFSSVAHRYDIMNDLMSLGLHRLWKRFAVELLLLRPGQRVLDLAGGTGDLSRLIRPRLGEHGAVVLCDINAAMLGEGRRRLTDQGLLAGVHAVQADAEHLPYPDASFDAVIIAFGLRNVTDKDAALREMRRVLRPGGRVLVLEFSQPVWPGLKPVYDLYSFQVLPRLGRLVAGDADSYRYLAESIRMHPDQPTLLAMLQAAGLERCQVYNLCGGIVAAHTGVRL